MAASALAFQDRTTVFQRDANTEFQNAYNAGLSARERRLLEAICYTMSGAGSIERFASLKGISDIPVFEGSMEYQDVASFSENIEANEFGSGFEISHSTLQNLARANNLDLIDRIPGYFAERALRIPFKLLVDTLADNPTMGLDSTALFSDSHEFGDNNIAVTVSSTSDLTVDDCVTIWNEVNKAYASFTNDKGDPLFESMSDQKMVILGPSKFQLGFTKLARQLIIPESSAGVSNVFRSFVEYLSLMRFTQTANVIYAILPDHLDQDGRAVGNMPAFARTVVTEHEISAAGGDPNDEVFRNRRTLQTNIYGEEGLAPLDASRCIKITLST